MKVEVGQTWVHPTEGENVAEAWYGLKFIIKEKFTFPDGSHTFIVRYLTPPFPDERWEYVLDEGDILRVATLIG